MQMSTEFWSAHVAAANQEAIPGSEYARRHGLSVKSLYYWRRKLKQPGTTDTQLPTSQFVALRIAPGAAHQSHCTLALPSGLRLEMPALPQPEWLATLVRAIPGAH